MDVNEDHDDVVIVVVAVTWNLVGNRLDENRITNINQYVQ